MKRAEKSLKELLRTGIQGEERGEDVLPELEDAVPAVPLTLGHRRVHKAQDKGHVAPKSNPFGGHLGRRRPKNCSSMAIHSTLMHNSPATATSYLLDSKKSWPGH